MVCQWMSKLFTEKYIHRQTGREVEMEGGRKRKREREGRRQMGGEKL